MDLSLLMKIAGIAMVTSVVGQILSKIGKDDHSALVSVAGIILILVILVRELGELLEIVKEVFGL